MRPYLVVTQPGFNIYNIYINIQVFDNSIITASHLYIRDPAATLRLDLDRTSSRSSGTLRTVAGPIGTAKIGTTSGSVGRVCPIHSGATASDGEVVCARVVAGPALVRLHVLAKLNDEVACGS